MVRPEELKSEHRSPDEKFQVFVSSSFKDLEAERKTAVEVVSDLTHIPIALERFAASNASDLEVIKRTLRGCQMFVLILGHRYGELVPEENLELDVIEDPGYRNMSFTEYEYSIGQKLGLYTIVLQLAPREVTERRRDLDEKKEDDHRELRNLKLLERFQQRVGRHHRQFWSREPGDFKFKLCLALGEALRTGVGLPGWIRKSETIETGNRFLVEVVGRLKGFESLYERCEPGEQEDKKLTLADCFRERYIERLLKNKVNLFFESGSTVAYVAAELSKRLSEEVHIGERGRPNIHITTNNVLAYLLLWLCAKVPCSPWPWSPPTENRFGGWYGGWEKTQERIPDYTCAPLDILAKEEIDKLLTYPFFIERPALLLGAASGLQIGDNPKLHFPSDASEKTRAEMTAMIKNCRGPHVASYHNKVFKRFMYATKIPIMIFLTGDKIDCEIHVGISQFMLDSEFTWGQFCASHPVAFCIGCSQEEKTGLGDMFRSLKFAIDEAGSAGKWTAFIAKNARFIAEFDEQLA